MLGTLVYPVIIATPNSKRLNEAIKISSIIYIYQESKERESSFILRLCAG